MYDDNRLSVSDLRNDWPFRRRVAQVQSYPQGSAADGANPGDGSIFSPLKLVSLGKTVSALVTLKNFIAKLQKFLDARQSDSMHQDANRLSSVDGRFDTKTRTPIRTWRSVGKYVVVGSSIAMFLRWRETSLDMPYIRCPEKRCNVTHLETLIVLIEDVAGLSIRSKL